MQYCDVTVSFTSPGYGMWVWPRCASTHMRIVPGISALARNRSPPRFIAKHDGCDFFERLSRLAKRGLNRLIILNSTEEDHRSFPVSGTRTVSTHDEEDLANSVRRGVGSPLPAIRLKLLLPLIRPPPDLLELALVPIGRMDEDV
jgi:hypothetical protein